MRCPFGRPRYASSSTSPPERRWTAAVSAHRGGLVRAGRRGQQLHVPRRVRDVGERREMKGVADVPIAPARNGRVCPRQVRNPSGPAARSWRRVGDTGPSVRWGTSMCSAFTTETRCRPSHAQLGMRQARRGPGPQTSAPRAEVTRHPVPRPYTGYLQSGNSRMCSVARRTRHSATVQGSGCRPRRELPPRRGRFKAK